MVRESIVLFPLPGDKLRIAICAAFVMVISQRESRSYALTTSMVGPVSLLFTIVWARE